MIDGDNLPELILFFFKLHESLRYEKEVIPQVSQQESIKRLPSRLTIYFPSKMKEMRRHVLFSVKNLEILKTRGHSNYDESSEKKVNTIVYLPRINLLTFLF